jgi:DNA-binding IclR family transcriptional regulator
MAIQDRSYPQSIIRLFMSYIPTRVIYVAAKLRLADHIGNGGSTAQDLAEKLELHPGALYRVLRTLAGLGVVRQDEHDRFFVTPFDRLAATAEEWRRSMVCQSSRGFRTAHSVIRSYANATFKTR